MKRCGRRPYDDFEGLRPGAIAELERSLSKASGLTPQHADPTRVTDSRAAKVRGRDGGNQEKACTAEQIPTSFYEILEAEQVGLAHLKLDFVMDLDYNRLEGAIEASRSESIRYEP